MLLLIKYIIKLCFWFLVNLDFSENAVSVGFRAKLLNAIVQGKKKIVIMWQLSFITRWVIHLKVKYFWFQLAYNQSANAMHLQILIIAMVNMWIIINNLKGNNKRKEVQFEPTSTSKHMVVFGPNIMYFRVTSSVSYPDTIFIFILPLYSAYLIDIYLTLPSEKYRKNL